MSISLIESGGRHVRHDSKPQFKSQAVPKLAELAKSYTFKEVERRVAAGQQAVWGGASWEAPLIRACDTIPIGINELWREESLQAEAVSENYFQIPGEFCSMIKAMVGRLHLKRNDPIKRVLVFGSTCEPIGISLEHARREGYDVYTIDAATAFKPSERRDELVRFLVKELEKVAIWLTGKPVDEQRVLAEIKLKNLVSRKIRRILDLRLKNPYFLTSLPTLQVLFGSVHYYGDPEKFNAILDQLTEELEEAAQNPPDRPYIPLVLAGLIGGIVGGRGLLEAIEESNGVILGWVLFCTSDFREDVPPLESIAHYLFDAQVKGELGEAAGASATYRRVRVEELVKQTKARGIISSFVTGCPYGSVVQGLEREYFKKQGIPMVALETTVHDQPPTEEQITKVKTFIEILS
jgi:benzoyl-CoA reductase/2-hydroxyglutaryl-CoA dehydratase subunit BcrC/BadD/HgdB